MATHIPTTAQGWELKGIDKPSGWDTLVWNSAQPIPKLSGTDVLVKFHAASLNYRDVAIVKGKYPLHISEGAVPGADGSGQVLAVGERVLRFRPGDKVVTLTMQSGFFAGTVPQADSQEAVLGSSLDGTFRTHAVLDQQGLVRMPPSLSYEQAATISSTYTTAWNALFGGVRPLRAGDCVLVQGSGGVSVSALQLALGVNATVIATTSSPDKAKKLKELGASHVINYKEDVTWGKTARKLSPRGLGCTHVIDNAGSHDSYAQSLEAVARGGEIQVVGYLAEENEGWGGPTFHETLFRNCSVRGVMVGSRQQLEEANDLIEAVAIKPCYDEKVFELQDLKAAYEYMDQRKHFGKIVVKIP